MDKKILEVNDVQTISEEFTKDLNNKVDKEEGKVLSSNDFTNEYIEKINAFEVQLEEIIGLDLLIQEVIE